MLDLNRPLLKGKRLQPLGSAFLVVWTAVEERIHKLGYATRRDLIRAAAKNLADVDMRTVWLDGFVTFSRLETEFLKALAANTQLTVVLPLGNEADEAYRIALQLGSKNTARWKGARVNCAPSSSRRHRLNARPMRSAAASCSCSRRALRISAISASRFVTTPDICPCFEPLSNASVSPFASTMRPH